MHENKGGKTQERQASLDFVFSQKGMLEKNKRGKCSIWPQGLEGRLRSESCFLLGQNQSRPPSSAWRPPARSLTVKPLPQPEASKKECSSPVQTLVGVFYQFTALNTKLTLIPRILQLFSFLHCQHFKKIEECVCHTF